MIVPLYVFPCEMWSANGADKFFLGIITLLSLIVERPIWFCPRAAISFFSWMGLEMAYRSFLEPYDLTALKLKQWNFTARPRPVIFPLRDSSNDDFLWRTNDIIIFEEPPLWFCHLGFMLLKVQLWILTQKIPKWQRRLKLSLKKVTIAALQRHFFHFK